MHSNGPWTLFHWKKYISKLQTHQFAGSSKIFRLRFLQGCIFTTCIQHDSPSQGIVLSHQEIVKHHANRPAVALPTSTRQTATKSGAQNESKRVYKKRNHWEVSIYIYMNIYNLNPSWETQNWKVGRWPHENSLINFARVAGLQIATICNDAIPYS